MKRDYLSFLLRIWRVRVNGKPVWRASLEYPVTRERKGFANLRELITYLKDEVRKASEDDDEMSDR